jgi:hypothetical protein
MGRRGCRTLPEPGDAQHESGRAAATCRWFAGHKYRVKPDEIVVSTSPSNVAGDAPTRRAHSEIARRSLFELLSHRETGVTLDSAPAGQAFGRGAEAALVELVDERLASLLGVAFVDLVIERPLVRVRDAIALAFGFGQLGVPVARGARSCVAGPRQASIARSL